MMDLFALAPQTAECAYVAIPEASQQAMRYYHSGNILWIIAQSWTLFVPFLFLVRGFSGKLQNYASKLGKNWFFTIFIYLGLFTPIFQLLNLPLDFYAGFMREHTYGLSTQSIGRWLENYGISFLVGFISAAAFVWIFYLLLKRSPKRWWFYGSLVSMGITFLMMIVQPIWIDPLFNKFGPMKDKKLEQQILALASQAGIDHGRVFEVDKSKDTKTLNAYVVGFGATNRIVLWDTTLQKMTTDEVLFVMAHEMGHYVLHHVWWFYIYISLLSLLIFYCTYKAATFLLHRYYKRFRFKNLYEIASLPLFMLVTSLLLFLASPLTNGISRYMEREADRFGLELTQNNKAAAEAFIVLQYENLANPRPGLFNRVWRGTHPSLAERITFCNSYCPWRQNEPLRYEKHFNR